MSNDIAVNDQELEILRHAISVHNDITNDTVFDSIESVNMFPKEDIIVSPEQMQRLRGELNEAINLLIATRSLMEKFGLSVNEDGYST